jgi:hypothetical protein
LNEPVTVVVGELRQALLAEVAVGEAPGEEDERHGCNIQGWVADAKRAATRYFVDEP